MSPILSLKYVSLTVNNRLTRTPFNSIQFGNSLTSFFVGCVSGQWSDLNTRLAFFLLVVEIGRNASHFPVSPRLAPSILLLLLLSTKRNGEESASEGGKVEEADTSLKLAFVAWPPLSLENSIALQVVFSFFSLLFPFSRPLSLSSLSLLTPVNEGTT